MAGQKYGVRCARTVAHMKTRACALLTTALICFLPGALSAQVAPCTVTLTLAPESTGVRATAVAGSSCGGSSVTIYFNHAVLGWLFVAEKYCQTGGCTVDEFIDFHCSARGDYEIWATSGCTRPVDGGPTCGGGVPRGEAMKIWTVEPKKAEISKPVWDPVLNAWMVDFNFPDTNGGTVKILNSKKTVELALCEIEVSPGSWGTYLPKSGRCRARWNHGAGGEAVAMGFSCGPDRVGTSPKFRYAPDLNSFPGNRSLPGHQKPRQPKPPGGNPSPQNPAPKFCPPSLNADTGGGAHTVPLFQMSGLQGSAPVSLQYNSAPVTYESLAPSGRSWTHTFSEILRPPGTDDEFLYHLPADGAEAFYRKTAPDTWTPFRPSGYNTSVTRAGDSYTMRYGDGATAAFSAVTGRWTRTTDRWGNATTAQYDVAGNLQSVTDPLNRVTQIVENGGLMQQIILPDGAIWNFTYQNGLLRAIHDPLHPLAGPPWRSFTYKADAQGEERLLTSVADDTGVVIDGYGWDASDRVTSLTGHDEMTIEYLPYNDRRFTRTIDANRTQVATVNVGVIDNRPVAGLVSGEACTSCGSAAPGDLYSYDTFANMIEARDANNTKTAYTYDANGNILTVTEAASTPSARSTNYAYGLSTWPAFATSITVPGPFGNRVTARTWSLDERVLTETVTGRTTAGGTATSFTTVTTFDARHRVIQIDGPRTGVTDVEARDYYADDDADVLRRGRLRTITSPAGLVTTFDEYDAHGTARRITDANGAASTAVTDVIGRTLLTSNPAIAGDPNETSGYSSTIVYGPRDRVARSLQPRGNGTAYTYNEDGELTDTILIDESGNQRERLHRTLNGLGWKTREESQRCISPAAVCTAWQTTRDQSFGYDDSGNLIEVINPDGTSIANVYDNLFRMSSVRDERHAQPNTAYAYDILNRLTSVTQTLSGALGGTVVTSYTYNVQDQLTSVTDTNGNVTTYVYDDFGRLASQSSPITGTTSYSYDPAGNLISTTDANGATTTRTYDAANRPLSSLSSRAGQSETVTWTYDSTVAGAYGKGRLASTSDPSGSTTYQYDRRGLLRREQKTIEGNTYTTAFAYDANGNRSSIVYPSGRTVAYTFDHADRPLSATNNGAPLASGASYLPFGPLAQLTHGNGTTVTRSYDSRYRLLTNRLAGTSGTVAQHDYTHDSSANVLTINDAVNGSFNRTFGYDDLQRLVTANSGAGLWGTGSYAYDRMGNLTSSVLDGMTRVFSYSGTTPRLTSVGANGALRNVTYDAAGNEITVGTEAFTHTPRNHVASAPGLGLTYDGRGVRTITAGTPGGLTITGLTVPDNSAGDVITGTVTLSGAAPAGGLWWACRVTIRGSPRYR